MSKKFWLPVALLPLVIFSCTQNIVYQKNININDGWHQDSIAVFNVNIADTIGTYNIFINLRNNNRYPYQNLWLFVRSVSPDSIVRIDTLESILAANDGKWIGSGFGSNYNLALFYMEKINFPVVGKYHFSIEQAMRNERLEGITGVGLQIEKAE